MTSRTMSPMSYRSPSVSVISSPSNFEALVIFGGLVHFVPCAHFNCVEVALGSVPSSISSILCLVVKSEPLSSCVMVAPATTVFSVALVCSAVAFPASRETLTSSTSYSFRFYCASSLAASFCICIATSSSTARSAACHFGGHESSTVKTTSSITMNKSLVQFCSGSFYALIYTLCISTLKSAKLHRMSYTVGDKCSRLLIHIHTLASMSIQKISISWMRIACLVSHSDAYFATSGKS